MKRFTPLLLSCNIFLANQSHADPTGGPAPAPVELPAVVVSDNSYRVEETDPFSFKEITHSELKSQIYGQEPSFILNRTPSITSYSDSGSYQGYSYFRLRGIDQTRLNITLDGVPLNEPEDQGVYFSNYPDFLNSVDRLQIIRGVGISQNGTASYGGSLQFDSYDLSQPEKFELGGGAGSFGTVHSYVEYNTGAQETGAEGTTGAYLRLGGLRSDGYRRRSGNESGSLYYKVGSLDKEDQWTVSGFIGRQANKLAWIGATAEQIANDRRFNANGKEDDNFLQTLSQVKNVRQFGDGQVLTTSVYYNHLQGDYDFDLNAFLNQPSTNELLNYDFRSHFIGAYSNYQLAVDDTKLTTGVHANSYEREHTGSDNITGPLYRNKGKKNEASAFGRVERRFGEFALLTDVQYRYTEFDYVGDANLQPTNWSFFNPKAGTTYSLVENATLYYSIGRTGREPTRNDILAGNDNLLTDESGSTIVGATEEESVVDQELGIRATGKSWNVQLNGYYMNFSDEIVLNGKIGPNGLPLTQSVDSSYRTGLELDYNWSPGPTFNFPGNVSLNYSRIKEDDLSFRPVMTPRWIANQAVQYSLQNLILRADLRFQSASFINFANDLKIGSWLITDLSIQYVLGQARIGAHLNNLFDKDYFSNGYTDFAGEGRYFVQAPRNFFISVAWQF